MAVFAHRKGRHGVSAAVATGRRVNERALPPSLFGLVCSAIWSSAESWRPSTACALCRWVWWRNMHRNIPRLTKDTSSSGTQKLAAITVTSPSRSLRTALNLSLFSQFARCRRVCAHTANSLLQVRVTGCIDTHTPQIFTFFWSNLWIHLLAVCCRSDGRICWAQVHCERMSHWWRWRRKRRRRRRAGKAWSHTLCSGRSRLRMVEVLRQCFPFVFGSLVRSVGLHPVKELSCCFIMWCLKNSENIRKILCASVLLKTNRLNSCLTSWVKLVLLQLRWSEAHATPSRDFLKSHFHVCIFVTLKKL